MKTITNSKLFFKSNILSNRFIKTTMPAVLIIIMVGFSTETLISQNHVVSSNSDQFKNANSALTKMIQNLENNLPMTLKNPSNVYRNVIFHYSSLSEQAELVAYVKHNGLLIDDLQAISFILAKIPYTDYSNLKNNNFNVFLDQQYTLIPNITSMTSTAQQSTYQIPIDQINGRSLASTYKGQGIYIAEIDSGIDATHPDLKGQIMTSNNISYVNTVLGYSDNESATDDNGHGTHVAALAVGTGTASLKMTQTYIGIAPDAKIYNLKVIDAQGSGTESGILEAINKSIELKVNIITMSLGFPSSDPNDPVSIAIDTAVNKHGIVATISAGNSGPGIGTIATPGAARSVITVGASYNENNSATFFSSRGPNTDYRYDPDILAPGWHEISALAQNSLLDLSEQYYSPNGIITGNNGNYIAESGTSMAAPIVAGAVAILLSKYNTQSVKLTPQDVRSALMVTATNTGQPEYVQGAGFINLANASQLISQKLTTGSNKINVISLLPQRSIFPDNPVLNPGDSLHINLQFVAGNESNVAIHISNSTVASLITYNKSFTQLQEEPSQGYYGELLINFTVPLNPKPGIYSSSITVTTDFHNYNISLGPILVKIPKRQIAWNIWYQSDGTDSPSGNYASLATYLSSQNITLVPVNQPVDSSWIYDYNTIVFPDNEMAIPSNGLTLLKDYINTGGKVIIISSFYPFSSIDNYNELTQSYGIKIMNTTDMQIIDAGIAQTILPIDSKMQSLNNNIIPFNPSTTLDWYGGTYLQTGSGDSVFGKLTNNTAVMAGFFGNQTSRGQLFVFGSEYWFYNDYFGQNEKQFSNTFFNYVVNNSAPFINIIPSSDTIQTGQSWNASIFVGNANFDNVSNSIVKLTLWDNSIFTPSIIQEADTLGGFINFVSNHAGKYNLTVQYDNKISSTIFTVYNKTIEYNLLLQPSATAKNYPYYLVDSGIPVLNAGDNIAIGFKTNESVANLNVSAEITLVPEYLQQYSGFMKQANALFSYQLKLSKVNDTFFDSVFYTTADFNNGFYNVELIVNQGTTQYVGLNDNTFFVSSPNPTIDTQNSMINGKSFSTYDLNQINPTILSINPSQKIDFSITGSSSNDKVSAFVIFVPYFPFIERGDIINIWQINSTSSNVFSGSIILPGNTSLKSNGITLNFGSGFYTAFLIIFRDGQGNIDLFPIVAMEQAAPFSLNEAMIFFIFVVVPGIIVIVYYFKSKGRRKQDSYNYSFNSYQYGQPPMNPYGNTPTYPNQQNYPPQTDLKFCPYCGSGILPGSNFCMECGKKIQ